MLFGAGTSLYSLDTIDGSLQWRANAGSNQLVWPPVLGKNTVYAKTGQIVNGNNTTLRAYSLATGAPLNNRAYPVKIDGNMPVYDNGILYGIANSNTALLNINAANGDNQWIDNYPSSSMGGYVPAVTNQYVISYRSTSYTTGELAVFNKSNGQAVMKIPDPHFVQAEMMSARAPLVGPDGAVYVVQGNRMLRFNLNTASIDWEVGEISFYRNPVLAKGNIYSIANGSLEARKANDGKRVWSIPYVSGESMVVTNNLIFVSQFSNTIAFDLATQNQVWNYPAGGSLAIQNGTLYISTPERMIAIDLLGDNDGDGLPTFWENRYGGKVNPDSDTDRDGLTARQEFQHKLNPAKADTDDDGIMDADEIL